MSSVFMRWELLVSVMTSCWSQTPHLNQQSARRGYVQEPGMASVSCSSCFKEYVNVTYACCCKWAFPLVNLEFSIWIRASLWVWSQFFSIQTQSTSTISPAGVKPSIPPPALRSPVQWPANPQWTALSWLTEENQAAGYPLHYWVCSDLIRQWVYWSIKVCTSQLLL